MEASLSAQSLKGLGDKQCSHIKQGGVRCRSFHQRASTFCFTHDPEKTAERAEAVKRGGLSQRRMLPALSEAPASALLLPSKPLKLRKPRDVKRAIAVVLGEIRTGAISLDQGRTLLYGLGVQIQAIRDLEAPERLEKLERILEARGMLQE